MNMNCMARLAHGPQQRLPLSLPDRCPARRAPTRCCASEAGAATAAAAAPEGPRPALSRRAMLQGLTVGGAHAWAGRSAGAAEAPPAGLGAAAALAERVTEFALPTGLRFLVSERRAAPVVSCHVHADVGAFDEEDGQTGIAHLLEHMAFKGTPRIGTRDYRREAPLLDALDEVFYSLLDAGTGREAERLQRELLALQAQAAELTVPNAYGALLQREGAVGLNASTSQDATTYYCSLPANKLELWFALESERFQVPVFRELYSEKAVVSEERRLRVDNAPLGPWQEAFSLASLTNNYRRPTIGFQRDIDRIGRREVQQFFQRHYGPSSLVIAIAGDVRAEQVRNLAEKYFGGWQPPPPPGSPAAAAGTAAAAAAGAAAATAAAASTASSAGGGGWWGEERLPRPEAPAGGRLEYRARARAGPGVMQAYYRPSARSPDALELEMIGDVLSGGRSSRLFKGLVVGGRALVATTASAYPGEKHAGQFVCYGIPVKGVSLEQLDRELSAQVGALAEAGPTPEELRRYKKSARVTLLTSLVSNPTLAGALASYQALAGDWRALLRDLERIEGMGAGAVRDAAGRLFAPGNCYRGLVLREE